MYNRLFKITPGHLFQPVPPHSVLARRARLQRPPLPLPPPQMRTSALWVPTTATKMQSVPTPTPASSAPVELVSRAMAVNAKDRI